MRLKIAALAAAAVVALGCALSFVHPWGDPRAVDQAKTAILPDLEVPFDVRQTLVNKCADCHSNATRWPIYARVAPASWLVERDIVEARRHMNLSAWQDYDKDTRTGMLSETAAEVRRGEMPVKQYLILHPDARLTDAEPAAIISWTKVERARLRAAQ